MSKLKNTDLFRLACITILWVLICWLLVATQPFSLKVAFVIGASAIIVFVPLYKKYFRTKDEHNSHNSKNR